MLSNIKKRTEGFTIIEVLIVLAIAGLILLIVFLAVPALQRNSRNTQVKNAASAILGAVSEYQNNNQGLAPTTAAISGTTLTISGAAGTTPSTAKVQSGYTVDTSGSMPASGTTGAFSISLGHKCNGNAFDSTSTPRAVAIGYNIETGSSTANQCVES